MTAFPNLAAGGRVPTVILGLVLGVVCGGCSALDPDDTKCGIPVGPPCVGGAAGAAGSGNGGGAGAGGDTPPDPAWSCLDDPYVSTIERPPTVSFAMAIVDFNNPSATVALPGLQGNVCQITDYSCAQPLAIPVVTQVPMAPAALVAVGAPLPFGYDGYLRFNAPNYLQTEYYFVSELGLNLDTWDGMAPPRIVGDPITLPLASRIDEFFELVTGSAANRDPEGGIIALRTFDCLGRRAANVSLEILSDTPGTEFPWVFNNRLPSARTKTDAGGVAGFGNVSTKMGAVIELRGIAPDGTPYGSVTVIARPNTLTFGDLRPAGARYRTPPAPAAR